MLLDIGISLGGPILKAGGLRAVHVSGADDDHCGTILPHVRDGITKEPLRGNRIVGVEVVLVRGAVGHEVNHGEVGIADDIVPLLRVAQDAVTKQHAPGKLLRI